MSNLAMSDNTTMKTSQLVKHELRALFTNPVVILTVFIGVIFYSFLYPLPYSKQTPREQEITVVNQDKSLTSYQLERMVDATPQVKLVARSHTVEQAKQQFLAGDVHGILVIPKDFYKDLLLGKAPVLSLAGDASYFLVYGTVVSGLAQAAGTLGAQAKVVRMLSEGVPLSAASNQYAATSTNLKPTFNPEVGYIHYVVPGVFVLILQQTLVMGIGLLGGSQKSVSGYWGEARPLQLMLVRSAIFVAIYYLMSCYYLGFSFEYYGIHKLASPTTILAWLAPFLFTSSFIGIILGKLLPRRELVTVVVLFSSMPLIFSSGFIWPISSVPEPMIWLTSLFPSTPAIQGLLKLDQMGASFDQVLPQWGLLWGQFIGWGLCCYMVLKLKPAPSDKQGELAI